MPTPSHIAAHLTSILGHEFVREEANTIAAVPADTQQISELLRYANQNHLTITPVGGGTKQSWGNSIQPNPIHTNIRLELHRLNRVLEHPWQDLTCTVQAGCTWSAMQLALAQHNQFVALDPLFPARATVGGIVATNDSGTLRHRYGSLRDLILGMTIVLADGTIARTGGKVVKNVAGYDLHKLMTGAFGTLGIITEVTFRLHPLPLHAHSFTVSAPQAAQLAPLIAAIRDSHLLTQALQLRGLMDQAFHLDIQLNAHPEAKQHEMLEDMTRVAGLTLQSAPEEIWGARENLFEEKNRIALKATMSPTDVCHFSELLKSYEGNSVTQAYGIMTGSLFGIMNTAFHSLREDFAAKGGEVSLLQQYEGIPNFGESPSALPLMRAIKHQFDPNHILNPNRFLGGI